MANPEEETTSTCYQHVILEIAMGIPKVCVCAHMCIYKWNHYSWFQIPQYSTHIHEYWTENDHDLERTSRLFQTTRWHHIAHLANDLLLRGLGKSTSGFVTIIC